VTGIHENADEAAFRAYITSQLGSHHCRFDRDEVSGLAKGHAVLVFGTLDAAAQCAARPIYFMNTKLSFNRMFDIPSPRATIPSPRELSPLHIPTAASSAAPTIQT
jgi:hypothetical protein